MSPVIVRPPRSPPLPEPQPIMTSSSTKMPPARHKYYARRDFSAAAPPPSALPIPNFVRRSLTSTVGRAVGRTMTSNSHETERSRVSSVKAPSSTGHVHSSVSHRQSDHDDSIAQKPMLMTPAPIDLDAMDRALQKLRTKQQDMKQAKALQRLQDRTRQKMNAELQEREQRSH